MESLPPLQLGAIDKKAFTLIDIIDSYKLATDFARWISGGKYRSTVLKELSEQSKFTKVVQFSMEDSIFFTGTGEFFTDAIDEDMVRLFMETPQTTYSKSSGIGKLKKSIISKVVADPYYTVLSRYYAGGKIAAASWAVFNIPHLIKIYDSIQPMSLSH